MYETSSNVNQTRAKLSNRFALTRALLNKSEFSRRKPGAL